MILRQTAYKNQNKWSVSVKKLDFKKIKDKNSSMISSKEALKDVILIKWSDDVLTGKKKVIIDSIDK